MAMPDTEQDIFDSALTDKPMDNIDAPMEVEVTTEKPDQSEAARQRDEKGRFVAAEKPAEEVAPDKARATQEITETDPPAQQQERQERGEIPAWRLKEEADAKREALARAEQFQRQVEEAQRRVVALEQQLNGFQQRQAEQSNPPPDRYADPDGYEAYQQQQYQIGLRNQAVSFSEQLARIKFGDELYGKAEQEIARHVQMNPHDPIVHVIRNSSQPAFEVVKWYQQQEASKRLAGKSIDDLLKEEREKALNDPEFLAKAIEKSKGIAKPVQQTANTNIPSLNRATAAASDNNGNEDSSDAALFKSALAR